MKFYYRVKSLLILQVHEDCVMLYGSYHFKITTMCYTYFIWKTEIHFLSGMFFFVQFVQSKKSSIDR